MKVLQIVEMPYGTEIQEAWYIHSEIERLKK